MNRKQCDLRSKHYTYSLYLENRIPKYLVSKIIFDNAKINIEVYINVNTNKPIRTCNAMHENY